MKVLKNIVLIILLVILIYIMHCKYIKQEELIKLFGKSILVVTTGSMNPTIDSEELIIISEKENYEINDIVTYEDKDGFLITHRIIELNENEFITKGDSNNLKDEPCDINKIQGKVIFHSKVLGVFVLYFLKPIIFIYLTIIIFVECIKLFKKQKSNSKECKENKS